MQKKALLTVFKTTLPVLFGYISLGIAFGIVLVDAQYPWYLAPIMSLFIYAGAAQFVAVGLFTAGTPLITIIITEALVNIRHIVYGLSLISKYKQTGKWKPYLIFALTDETYSLLTTTDVPEGMKPSDFYGLVSLLDQSYWFTGSLLGAILGSLIPFDLTGADFALTALFAVLTVEQILKTKDSIPVLIGGIAAIGTLLLWKFGCLGANASNILITALCIGIAALIIFKKKEYMDFKTEQKEEQQ